MKAWFLKTEIYSCNNKKKRPKCKPKLTNIAVFIKNYSCNARLIASKDSSLI